MSVKIIIGYDDRVDSGTVVADSEEPTLPASNLRTGILTRVWQTLPGVNSARLVADLGAVRQIGAVCLGNTNLTGGATCRVRLSATDAVALSSLTYDSGEVEAGVSTSWELLVHIVPSGNVSARYVGLDLSDDSLDVLNAGRLWAFRTYRPAINYQFGWQRLLRDQTERTLLESGATFEYQRPRVRGVRLRLQAPTRSDYNVHLEFMQRITGISQDLMLCMRPDAEDLGQDTYIGPPEEPIGLTQTASDVYPAEFTVFERQ